MEQLFRWSPRHSTFLCPRISLSRFSTRLSCSAIAPRREKCGAALCRAANSRRVVVLPQRKAVFSDWAEEDNIPKRQIPQTGIPISLFFSTPTMLSMRAKPGQGILESTWLRCTQNSCSKVSYVTKRTHIYATWAYAPPPPYLLKNNWYIHVLGTCLFSFLEGRGGEGAFFILKIYPGLYLMITYLPCMLTFYTCSKFTSQ